MSESGDKFRAATGLTVESSNNLMQFLVQVKTVVTLSFAILQADYHKISFDL